MKRIHLLSVVIFTVATINTQAQDSGSRFSFEFNAGPSFATQDLGGNDLNIGAGFEALFHYNLYQHLDVYAGWGWNRFGSDDPFQGIDADFEETGYVFGLKFAHPIENTPLSWSVRAGGLYNHIEIENSAGDIVWDTGHGLGFHAAAALDIRIAQKWTLSPTVLFHTLSRDLDVNGNAIPMDLRYLSARIGFVRAF